MQLNINGKTYTIKSPPETLLLWVLRDELALTGTKYGCGIGLCGSCTVHINGQAARACVTPVSSATGQKIRTIEGLGNKNKLHPVQQAFLQQQTLQCGWCMSGQMMQAAAFLDNNPKATDREALDAMSNNLCRCHSYVRIKKAVLTAKKTMQGGL